MTYQEWQRGLIRLGYDLGKGGPTGKGDDGVPGRLSQQATIAFKKQHGLSATATVGPQSIAAMQAELAKRSGVAIPAMPPKGLDPVWIIEARRWLGEREVPGKGSNMRILRAIQAIPVRILGIRYTDDDEAWCGAILAVWIAATLSAEVLPNIAVRASAWDVFGRKLNALAYGAIVRFQRPGGGHVGICVGRSADGKLVRVLGGNQSNKVSETWIEEERLVSIRYPSSVNSTPQPAPILNAAGAVISRNEA